MIGNENLGYQQHFTNFFAVKFFYCDNFWRPRFRTVEMEKHPFSGWRLRDIYWPQMLSKLLIGNFKTTLVNIFKQLKPSRRVERRKTATTSLYYFVFPRSNFGQIWRHELFLGWIFLPDVKALHCKKQHKTSNNCRLLLLKGCPKSPRLWGDFGQRVRGLISFFLYIQFVWNFASTVVWPVS